MTTTDLISDYEKGQYDEIVKWKNEEPGIVSQVTGVVLKPVTWLVQKVIPTKGIEGVLNGSNWLAETLTDSDDICRDGGVANIRELQYKDLELSDRLANNCHNWAIAIALSEGGAAGALGLPGMIADVPALITMSLRLIHKIGLCYGYQCETEADKNYVLAIMSAAGANSVHEKMVSVSTLQMIRNVIAKNTWKKIAEKAANNKFGIEAAIIAIKELAKRLGINITKRKAAQAVPIVGGAVGAAVNADYVRDVGWAARRAFQERWLSDNGKITD